MLEGLVAGRLAQPIYTGGFQCHATWVFFLTTDQVRNRTKTVTRRNGWWFLKPGEIVNAVEKAMGLKRGEKIKRICQIRIVSTRAESLP